MASTHTSLDAKVRSKGQNQELSEPLLVGSALFFVLAAYIATIRFDFVYDDEGQIVANTLVHYWRYVPDYFRGRTWQSDFQNASVNYFRPMNFVWLRANDALFGLHPHGWHVTAVLLHLLNALLVYFVARSITQRPRVAALTALFFGIHPMTHEVAAWISGTTESLWCAFALGAFLAYLRFRNSHRNVWLFASCAFYAAAVFAKETAITLPALIFTHWLIYGDSSNEAGSKPRGNRLVGAVKVASCYIPVVLAYLAARLHALQGFSHPQLRISRGTFLLTLPSVAFFYFKHWLLPLHVSEFYDIPVSAVFSFKDFLLPLGGLALLAILLWSVRRSLGAREVALAAAWLVIPLAPAMDFMVFPAGDMVHDRYFYFPSFGAALLLALALDKLAAAPLVYGLPRRMLFVTLALVVTMSYATANAAAYWRDNLALFEHSYSLAPHNYGPRVNYAVELARQGQLGDAIPIFEKILQERPDNYPATYGLGRALYQAGILKPSEHFFEHARDLNPNLPGAYLNLGLIAMKTHRIDEGVADMRRALEIEPLEPGFHFALGMALQQQGNCRESIAELRAALNLQPDMPHAQEQMSKCTPSTLASEEPNTAPSPSAAASMPSH